MYLIQKPELPAKSLELAAQSLAPQQKVHDQARLDQNHRQALDLLEALGLEPAADLRLPHHYLDPAYARDDNFYLLISSTEICVGMMDGYSIERSPKLSTEWNFCGSDPCTIHLRQRRPDRPKSRAPLSGSITNPLHAFLILPKIHEVPTGHLHSLLTGVKISKALIEAPWLADILGDAWGLDHIERISVHHWRIKASFFEAAATPKGQTDHGR